MTNQVKISKFLSLVLRHQPQLLGIELDQNGWTSVEKLLEKMNSNGRNINFETLEFVVNNNNKQRFAFNNDKTKIRANQGHSIKIDLAYEAKTPPQILFHGTGKKYLKSIYKAGLKKMNRHHVHLSKDIETALSVGKRHGIPVIFEIKTEQMVKEGYEFFESENGVWLINEVPIRFLQEIENSYDSQHLK